MKSILIVEDEDIIAYNIATSLNSLGYKNTYIAKSGARALKIIEEKASRFSFSRYCFGR